MAIARSIPFASAGLSALRLSGYIRLFDRAVPTLPALPLIGWIVFFVAVPFGFTVAFSFQTYDYYNTDLPWTVKNYQNLVSSPQFAKLFGKTVLVSLVITVVSLAIASPMAYYLARIARRRVGLLLVLVAVLPLWMNIVVRNYAWMSLVNNKGVFNTVGTALGLEPLQMLFTIFLVAAVGITLFIPIALLVLYGSMGNISSELEEGAMDLGYSRLRTFLKVIFPLSSSAYQTAALLVFMPALALYVTPNMLGGTDGALLASVLMPVVKTGLNFAKGGAIVVPIIIILMVLVYILRRGLNIENIYRAGIGSNIARTASRKNTWLLGYTVLIIAITYMPIVSLVFFSFEANTLAQLPLMGFSLRWWEDMSNSVQLLSSLRASIYVALETAGITIALSAPAAYAITRFRLAGRGLIIFMSILPMLIPEFILGMSILLTLDALNTDLSLHTIAMGHATLALPFVFLTILAQQYGFDRDTEAAAKDLGAGPIASFIKVTLPPMLTAIAAAAFLAVTVSFGDYVVAFLLTGTTTTLPIYIFGLLKSGVSPTVNAAGSMLLFGIVAIVAVAIVRPWRYAGMISSRFARLTP